MALTKYIALDIIRAHIDRRMAMEPVVLRDILQALASNDIKRGNSRGLAHVTCCEVTAQARAFIAGRPVNVDTVTSMAALLLSYHHVHGEVKHVA